MKYPAIPLIVTLLILGPAIYFGKVRVTYIEALPKIKKTELVKEKIPSLGSVEILNGCGARGVAKKFKNFLRANNYDVKSAQNAASWNYDKTIIVSRIPDMQMAKDISSLFKCDDPIFIRTAKSSNDVTVIIGHDYGELNYE